jgi:hypothetical protein
VLIYGKNYYPYLQCNVPQKKHMTPNPIGRPNMHSKCLDFYFFLLFSTYSFQGCNEFPSSFMFPRFPMCSTRVFLITPSFNPICFAQSPPLLTCIGGPKGEALHRIFYVLEPPKFELCFLQWANQIDSLQN